MCLPLSEAISITCIWHSHTGMMYNITTIITGKASEIQIYGVKSYMKPTNNVGSDSFSAA